MECIKCKGKKFKLETSILVKETYNIYKNGNISWKPQKTEIEDEDMTDNENIIRCINCRQGYVLERFRRELLNKINYNNIDLEKEGHLTRF